MGIARTHAVALVGIEGHLVEVEADIAMGMAGCTLVGLPDASLSESRDRVRAAIVNSRQEWPSGRRITVNLSPASLPKRGSGFDLAIAAAILAATGAVPASELARTVLLGELGLDGRLRHGRGVLPSVVAAARRGMERVVVPETDAAEAALVPDIEVVAMRSLQQFIARLRREPEPDEPTSTEPGTVGPALDEVEPPAKDLADVLGQHTARWALELAAAGGHHVHLLGPPGAGKTMLAERLPGLLPDLDLAAALEVTSVHSVAGALRPGVPLVTRPPYRAPHHTATIAAVVGGGTGVPRPGAVSLAHRGVLFLDEAPEFGPAVLEALREPLESGEIVLMRSGGTARYPAKFRLVLAANPCPCGFGFGKGQQCRCAPMVKRRYLGRISGPLLDRVDIRLWVDGLTRADLLRDGCDAESTATVAERVRAALDRAANRYAATPWRCNADPPAAELRRRWPLALGSTAPLEKELGDGRLTMRGADRVLRLAWTISDLAGVERPGKPEIHAALGLRAAGGRAA